MPRLWDKGLPLDERILRFTAGEDHVLDERLVAYDVRASVAHARMLAAQGLLAADDCNAICAGLEALGAAHAAGEWSIELADEDAHGALERRLIERIGAAGGRVHLGRSRNDQVLVALRLYLRDAIAELAAGDGRASSRRSSALAAEQGIDRAARLHAHAARDAEHGRALGARLRGRARGRPRRARARARARRSKPARLGRGLRRAELARSTASATTRGARLRAHARARDGGAAVARQGRGVADLRDRAHCSATSAGSRPTCSSSIRASSHT